MLGLGWLLSVRSATFCFFSFALHFSLLLSLHFEKFVFGEALGCHSCRLLFWSRIGVGGVAIAYFIATSPFFTSGIVVAMMRAIVYFPVVYLKAILGFL